MRDQQDLTGSKKHAAENDSVDKLAMAYNMNAKNDKLKENISWKIWMETIWWVSVYAGRKNQNWSVTRQGMYI